MAAKRDLVIDLSEQIEGLQEQMGAKRADAPLRVEHREPAYLAQLIRDTRVYVLAGQDAAHPLIRELQASEDMVRRAVEQRAQRKAWATGTPIENPFALVGCLKRARDYVLAERPNRETSGRGRTG